MQVLPSKKKKRSVVLRAVLVVGFLVIAVNVLYIFVQQRIIISERKAEVSRLQDQIAVQILKNEELRSLSENEDPSEYMEKIARESLNYAYPGEYVYINIAGTN